MLASGHGLAATGGIGERGGGQDAARQSVAGVAGLTTLRRKCGNSTRSGDSRGALRIRTPRVHRLQVSISHWARPACQTAVFA
jgi:hypothetical protein